MRRMTLIAGAAVAALALAGCGSGSGTAGSGDKGRQVEVFTWWADGSEKAGLDALVKVFDQQHPNDEFVNGAVAGGAGSNAKDKLATRLQAGDPPSTFQAHAGAELTDYIDAGQVEDLTSLYDSEGWKKIFPASLIKRLTAPDGKIYSVPANIHRANVVWANTAVLTEAGVTSEPTTMDEWFAALDKVKATGKTALSIGTDWTQVQLLETVLLSDLGPDGYQGLWDGKTDWKSGEVAKALGDYQKLLGYTNEDRSSLDWPDATQQVIDGKAAYNVMGDWAEASFQEAGKKFGTDYQAFPVPGTKGTFDFLADSFTLPVKGKNPDATKDWLKTVGSAEGQKAFNQAKGSIPPRTDANPSDYGAYQQTALTSWKEDTVVSSLAHGAAVPVNWLNDITTAVSKFSSNPSDVKGLQDALAKAASSNQAG